MDLQGVTPGIEQLWIDEVRYLHSLWRVGPPSKPIPNPNPNPNLRPANLTSFKKEKRVKKGQRRKERRENRRVSDIEWPVQPPPPPPAQTGWGDPKPQPARIATAEELAKFFAVQLQRVMLKYCQDFFKKKALDGDDEDDDDEDDDDEEDDLMEDVDEESGNFKFLLGLFSENGDLRSYYEKNWQRGEFFCLVCGGIGEKIGKKFGDCVAMVQHSTAIAKTKKRGAHRAFGRVVCRVLGWDINRLPSIVLDLGKPLGGTLAKTNAEEDFKEDVVIDQTRDLQKEGTGSVQKDVETTEFVQTDGDGVVDLVEDVDNETTKSVDVDSVVDLTEDVDNETTESVEKDVGVVDLTEDVDNETTECVEKDVDGVVCQKEDLRMETIHRGNGY